MCRAGLVLVPTAGPTQDPSPPAPRARSQVPLQGAEAAKMLSVTFPVAVASASWEGRSNLSYSHFVTNIFSLVTYF